MTVVSDKGYLDWGGRRVVYAVERTDQRRLKITVSPLGEVRVLAPDTATDAEIHDRVRRRGHWIVSQVKEFERYRPRTPPRQYLSGETHLLKGVQYRLRVVQAPTSNIYVLDQRIVIETPRADSGPHKAALMRHLYRLEAHRTFPARLEAAMASFRTEGLTRPPLIIRPMVKRWGSFTAKGNLVLNIDLIRAPVSCLDYVIHHEICHVLEPDHGPGWKRLMSRGMPDWQDRKRQLERALL